MATVSLLVITGSLVFLKLALMALTLVLLERALFGKKPSTGDKRPATEIAGFSQMKH